MAYDPNTGLYYDDGSGSASTQPVDRFSGYYNYAQPYAQPSSGGSVMDWINQAIPAASQIRGGMPNSDSSYWANLVPDFQQRYGNGWQQEMFARMQGKGASGADAAQQGPYSAAAGYHYTPSPQELGMGGFGFGGQSYNGPAFSMPDAPFSGFTPVNPGQFGYDPLNTPQNFQLPTGQQALDQDPGYQFRLQQGLDALQNSAAARGGLGDPNTLRAVQDYGQQSASQEYQNAYNRALQTYQTNTGTNLAAQQQQYQQGLGAFQTNAQTALQANNQNFQNSLAQYQANFQDPLAAYQANVNAQLGFGGLGLQAQLGLGNLGINQGYLGLATDQQGYNQLYNLANMGLQGTQGAANSGLGYFGDLTNLYGNNANAMGNLFTGQGNANAAGQVGSANAWNGAFGNLGNLGSQLGLLSALQNRRPQPQPNQVMNAGLGMGLGY